MRISRPVAFCVLPFAALLLAAGAAPTPPATLPATFTQGVITTRVSLPGNPLDKMLSQLDPSKKDMPGQMRQLMNRMTPAEQKQFQAEAAKLSPAIAMAAVMLPRKGTIYCRGQEARVSTDGLSYHLENYFDGAKNAGTILLASQLNPERLAYTYNASSMKKGWQSIVVAEEDYILKTSPETSLVAGYPSQKTTYTLKAGAAKSAPGSSNEVGQGIMALEVWTSAQIPQSLNFAHPVYVQEKHGITKLIVYFDKEQKQKLLYEFASVEPKTVTPQDLKITLNTPLLDYAKDAMQIGMQSLAIMMGGGGPEPAGETTSDD